MALLTDGPVVDAEELARYESSLLDVMRAEGVALDQKVALAQEECGRRVAEFLQKNLAYSVVSEDELLGKVVVDSRLRRWVAVRALWEVFRDVYSRQLNDRYAAKRSEYDALMREAESSCLSHGVGVVWQPLARAERPDVSVVAGSGVGGTFYVAVADWKTGVGEGALSEAVVITVPTGSQMVVATNGTTAWNVYAGTSPGDLTRQNTEPVADGQWMMMGPLRVGEAPGRGQRADTVVQWRRLLRRG